MFQNIVEKLIDRLPENSILQNKDSFKIDLVLEGGAFNGSYMLGILYFLKKLEEKQKIKIERISGVSIGAMLGLIYQLNSLDYTVTFYKNVYKHLKKKKNLMIVHTFCDEIKKFIKDDFYLSVNKKFFITYYDLKKGKKIIKSTYRNNDDLFDTVIRSSYISFICGKSCFYKNQYIDGIFPYLFKSKREILYINLSHYDKLLNMFIIKNEKNNISRILLGILDVYSFFYRKENTIMCSFVKDWKIFDHTYYCIKRWVEYFIFCNLWLYYLLERFVLDELSHTFAHQLFYRLLHYFNKLLIKQFCI